MQVKVKLFAILRERAGVGELVLDLSPGATVADAVSALTERVAALAEHIDQAAYAVNRSYVTERALLKDGDELALIPPVSGG